VTSYGYDALNRLSSVTPPGPTTTQYTYDGNGNRLTTQAGANPATTYTSDAADQLTSIGSANNNYDPNGNLTQLGDNTNTFLYDLQNRPVRTGPCLADVNGDGKVTILDLSSISGSGRYSSSIGATGYDAAFDLNGDGKITILDLSLAGAEYNRACPNTGPNTGEGDATYNGDGLRERAQTYPSGNVATDDYIWDQGASLPQVLQDTNTVNGVASTTTYLYGLNGLLATTDGGGTTRYYLQDGLGSTAQLTDIGGSVTDSYTYDVFGAVTSHTGTSAQPFTYTGQQQDASANRGRVYLRARMYDPALGRFLTKDPLAFMQAYSYGLNDPLNQSDPTGMFPLPRVSQAQARAQGYDVSDCRHDEPHGCRRRCRRTVLGAIWHAQLSLRGFKHRRGGRDCSFPRAGGCNRTCRDVLPFVLGAYVDVCRNE
jgi:RHS repeat-associated protein